MIKVARTPGGVDLVAQGPAKELVSEAAIAAVVVAQRVGATCEGYDSDKALELISKTARDVLDELRTEGVTRWWDD